MSRWWRALSRAVVAVAVVAASVVIGASDWAIGCAISAEATPASAPAQDTGPSDQRFADPDYDWVFVGTPIDIDNRRFPARIVFDVEAVARGDIRAEHRVLGPAPLCPLPSTPTFVRGERYIVAGQDDGEWSLTAAAKPLDRPLPDVLAWHAPEPGSNIPLASRYGLQILALGVITLVVLAAASVRWRRGRRQSDPAH